jgi:hypothetical protein
MSNLDEGTKYRFVNRHGVARRYVLERTQQGPPGLACFLSCLEPPHEPVEGYVGGASREARVLATSLRRPPATGVAGWLEGHE